MCRYRFLDTGLAFFELSRSSLSVGVFVRANTNARASTHRQDTHELV